MVAKYLCCLLCLIVTIGCSDDSPTGPKVFPGEVKFSIGRSGTPIDMIRLNDGAYWMGASNGELNSSDEERPRHLVNISGGFYLGKFEVTQQQWEAVMGSYPFPQRGTDLPVDSLADDPVYAFLDSLNLIDTTFLWRLPSEAEWEYACRAGTTTRFYWGDDSSFSMIGDYAWYRRNSFVGGNLVIHPVGMKRPNAWGFYDIIGNIYEMCQDDFHPNYLGAPTDGNPWVEEVSGSTKVLRGGTVFLDRAEDLRSATRGYRYTDLIYRYVGLRLVCEPR